MENVLPCIVRGVFGWRVAVPILSAEGRGFIGMSLGIERKGAVGLSMRWFV